MCNLERTTRPETVFETIKGIPTRIVIWSRSTIYNGTVRFSTKYDFHRGNEFSTITIVDGGAHDTVKYCVGNAEDYYKEFQRIHK